MKAESRINLAGMVAPIGDDPSQSVLWSKLTQRMYQEKSEKADQIFKEHQDYFARDEKIRAHLIASEIFSNMLFNQLLDRPEAGNLREQVEGNIHHGFRHTRRVEKWFKTIMANDVELRHYPLIQNYSLPAFLAIRLHDIVQVANGQKESHDEASGLFALGYFLREEVINHIVKLSHVNSNPNPLTADDCIKMAWALSFMCLQHSKPEDIPSTDILYRDGLIDLPKVLEVVSTTAQSKSMTLLDFFPSYSLITTFLESTRSGQIQQPE